METDEGPQTDQSRLGHHLLGVAATALLVYLPSLTAPFITWDDTYYVTNSDRIQAGGWEGLSNLWSLARFWNAPFIEFFPLRDSLYWAVFQLFGLNPVPYHACNMVLHAAVACLVCLLGRSIGLPSRTSLVGALLFAVHPIHVESIAWVSGLKDPMFLLFSLASVLAFLAYRKNARPLTYAACVVLLLAALLCKSIALATPLALIGLERWVGRPTPWARVLKRVGPLAILCALFAVLFVGVGKMVHVITPPHGGSWGANTLLAGWATVRYLQQAIAPTTFLLHYCVAPLTGLGDPRFWVMVVTLAVIVAGFAMTSRRLPLVSALLWWFLAFLGPVSNLVPFPAVIADRYLYAPSVAACLGLGWALGALNHASVRRLLTAAVFIAYGWLTVTRILVWRDEGALIDEVVEQPSCLEDDSSTTPVLFIKHALLLSDPARALDGFTTAFSMQGFGRLKVEDQCLYFTQATGLALRASRPLLAQQLAQRGAQRCPWLPRVWDNVAAANGGTVKGIEAAERALRLAPTATRKWNLGAARLRAGDLVGIDSIRQSVDEAPSRLCQPTRQLLSVLRAPAAEQLAGVLHACP